MSRIGKKPVAIPEGVTVTVDGSAVTVRGPKGSLEFSHHSDMSVTVTDQEVIVERPSESKIHRSIHGTTRAIINNMVDGVTEGYKKELKMIGVGYRAQVRGKVLVISAGYSHEVNMDIPEGLEVAVEKNTAITVSGIDKQQVGEFSANVRKVRPPEPYLGKGIRYVDEHVRRKEGKTAK
ncbi:MAG: 50S ribosomal protein L6 [Candidatus Izimaplasma sp.]|nr:50S ribosomal protein L6 [Candidatus Izimaplasma bacterium]